MSFKRFAVPFVIAFTLSAIAERGASAAVNTVAAEWYTGAAPGSRRFSVPRVQPTTGAALKLAGNAVTLTGPANFKNDDLIAFGIH